MSVRRARLLLVAFLVVLAAALAQLVNIQIIQGPQLAAQAAASRTYSYKLDAKRGDILDRNGMVLATSVVRYNLGVNQQMVANYVHKEYVDATGKVVTDSDHFKDQGVTKKTVGTGAAEAARQLAPILGQDQALLGGKMIGDSTFEYIAKDIDPTVYRQVRELKILGIEPEQVMKRVYPNGPTASSVLGFVDYEGNGAAGIELSANKQLAGTDGEESVELAAGGQLIPGGVSKTVEPRDGSNVKLTIDADLNQYAEQEVNAIKESYSPRWAAAVVLDVKTGEILALADSGNKDPAAPRKNDDFWGSHAVEDSFEPGSTFKLVTLATALEAGTVTPTSVYTCPYKYTTPNGEEIKDATEHPTADYTVAGIIANSLNTGVVQFGDTVSDQQLYETIKGFGFGQVTGVELPGEGAGILAPPEEWERRQRYTIRFGQGVSATSLQIAQMAATIGNNGVRIPPRIVDSYITPEGAVTKRAEAPATRVISEETAHTIARIMLTTTELHRSQTDMPGYQLGIKTGTAQTYEGGRQVGITTSTVGIAPVEDPRIAVFVVAYLPGGGWGSTVALPSVRRISERALRVLKVSPPSQTWDTYPINP